MLGSWIQAALFHKAFSRLFAIAWAASDCDGVVSEPRLEKALEATLFERWRYRRRMSVNGSQPNSLESWQSVQYFHEGCSLGASLRAALLGTCRRSLCAGFSFCFFLQWKILESWECPLLRQFGADGCVTIHSEITHRDSQLWFLQRKRWAVHYFSGAGGM